MINKYTLFIFGLIILFSYTGCKGGHVPEEAERPAITNVGVETAGPSTVEEYYEAAGTVKARTVSVIASRVMGTVTSIKVEEGDRVQRGQLLLSIDDRDAAARVGAAREGLSEAISALEAAREQKDLAEITSTRYKKLFEEKALTQQELDRTETELKVARSQLSKAEAAVERARASLKEAEVFLGFTRITSPISGIVTDRKIDPGSMAAPGTPLLVLEDDSTYRMEVGIDEKLIGRIKTGLNAEVLIPSLERKAVGKVVETVPAVDPSSRTFLVKVDIRDGALRSGLYGKVRFAVGTRQAVLLPLSAIVQKGQLTGVYIVQDSRVVSYRLVRVGKEHDGRLEILSGVKPGDRVIVEGAENAVDGGVLMQ